MSEQGNSGGGKEAGLDVAQRSLTDALKSGFGMLRGSMLLLGVAWLCSGFFSIDSKEMAMRVRFGRLVMEQNAPKVYSKPAWYFALPFPFERVVRVPAGDREVKLGDTFWFARTEQEINQGKDLWHLHTSLSEGRDGVLLTGDGGLLHLDLSAQYAIDVDRMDSYLRYVGDLEQADALVVAALQQATIQVTAMSSLDEVLAQDATWLEQVRSEMQMLLREGIDTGIVVERVTFEDATVPGGAYQAFASTGQAQSVANGILSQALTRADEAIRGAAGEAGYAMTELMQAYDRSEALGDNELRDALRHELRTALKEGRIRGRAFGDMLAMWLENGDQTSRDALMTLLNEDDSRDGLLITGEAARVVAQAARERDQLVAEANAWMTRYHTIRDRWEQNPQWTLADLQADVRELVLTRPATEIHYLPVDNASLELSPDPEAHDQVQEERREAAAQAAREQAEQGEQP